MGGSRSRVITDYWIVANEMSNPLDQMRSIPPRPEPPREFCCCKIMHRARTAHCTKQATTAGAPGADKESAICHASFGTQIALF